MASAWTRALGIVAAGGVGSNTVPVFARDPETGKLSPTATTLEVPEPSNVTFFAGK